MAISFYLLIFGAAALFVFGLGSLLEKQPVETIISIRRGGSASGFLDVLGRLFKPSDNERRENGIWLLQAGFESIDIAQKYRATRLLLMVSLPLVVVAVFPVFKPDVPMRNLFGFAIGAAVCGLLAPLLYVRRRRTRNQRLVREGLPDALDLLLVCSEAGLGLDTSIMKVGEEMASIHPVISRCLLQISSELRAGRPRADAMRGFGDRTGIQETRTLVNLLVQSDALGTSMATTLRAYAEDMRATRLLKAEELGQKISVKLSMILASCFLPALLIAIGAPIVNILMHTAFRIPLR